MCEMSAGSECLYDKLSSYRFIKYQVPKQQMGQQMAPSEERGPGHSEQYTTPTHGGVVSTAC